MNEETHFWVIPIIAFIAAIMIVTVSVDYKYNTVFPNAAIEREEIENMTCPEILHKNSQHYWSTENKNIGNAKAVGCTDVPKTESLGLNPYVEFCTPGGFAPVKKIDNSTHSFNHDTCVWDMK
ncbi:hypothetical protein K0U27_08695 [archaeon]|nr:hypothetical protein [archaeon]